MTGSQNMSTTTQRMRIYDFKHQLDSEKEYSQGQEYRFEIKIPADILSAKPQMPELGGKLGQGLKIAQTAAAMTGVIPLQQPSGIYWQTVQPGLFELGRLEQCRRTIPAATLA